LLGIITERYSGFSTEIRWLGFGVKSTLLPMANSTLAQNSLL
jgi:hypothetical protein